MKTDVMRSRSSFERVRIPFTGGAERSSAYKPQPLLESSSVLRVSGLPFTADNQAVAELFPGTMLFVARICSLDKLTIGKITHVLLSFLVFNSFGAE